MTLTRWDLRPETRLVTPHVNVTDHRYCPSEKDGYLCTRPAGHTGRHHERFPNGTSTYSDGVIIAVWTDAPSSSPSPTPPTTPASPPPPSADGSRKADSSDTATDAVSESTRAKLTSSPRYYAAPTLLLSVE